MNDSLGFWTIATNFLRLTEGACHQIVEGGNVHFLISDKPASSSEYHCKTLWSDHSIGVPVLFNFFHGIELILKGFIATSSAVPNHHKLTKLLSDFEVLLPMTALGKTIETYVCRIDPDSPLGRFKLANGIEIDSWYEALKYPTSNKGEVFAHAELKYGGSMTMDFWRNIGTGSSNIRLQAIDLAYSLRQLA